MSSLSPEMLATVLPLAVKWAQDGQQFIFQHGQPLTPPQQNDAGLAGVRQPERIRVLPVPHIPRPDDGLLAHANDALELITPATDGLTLFYGIFLRATCRNDRRLLVHEFVHVAQYEQLGGIDAFLRQYIHECSKVGYRNSPMELEANRISARICA